MDFPPDAIVDSAPLDDTEGGRTVVWVRSETMFEPAFSEEAAAVLEGQLLGGLMSTWPFIPGSRYVAAQLLDLVPRLTDDEGPGPHLVPRPPADEGDGPVRPAAGKGQEPVMSDTTLEAVFESEIEDREAEFLCGEISLRAPADTCLLPETGRVSGRRRPAPPRWLASRPTKRTRHYRGCD